MLLDTPPSAPATPLDNEPGEGVSGMQL
jgi:hypothetical protein